MKRLVAILIICISASTLMAQKDSTLDKHIFQVRRPGIFRLYTGIVAPPPDRADKFDRLNTDFYWNSWMGDQNGVRTKFYAIGHSISLMFDVPFEKKGRIGMGIGLGYSHFNIRSNGELNFIFDSTTYYSQLNPYDPPKRWINRTVFNFVEIPFELRFRAARERWKFKFYPGFKVGYMFEYFHKYRIEGAEYKTFNFPDINHLHYGPTLRMGFDNYMLFGYYDLAPLFTHNQSSVLQLYGVGISIGWF